MINNYLVHDTTESAVCQVMIADFLKRGREHAQTARQLSQMTGLRRRTITRMIRRERLAGTPICAQSFGADRGYYLPANQAELNEYMNRLNHREREINRTLEALSDYRWGV